MGSASALKAAFIRSFTTSQYASIYLHVNGWACRVSKVGTDEV